MIRLPALLAASLALANPALAAPALWEVRDADSAIWLFGSFHLLPEDSPWRTELFDDTLAKADSVVFEADIRPAAQIRLGAQALARGINTDGRLLTDLLDDEQEQQLRQTAQDYEMPIGTILAMQPWFAANMLTITAITSHGYSAEGVEALLQPEILDDRLAFLETGEEQLEFIAGAPQDEQLAMLDATLDELPTLPEIMEKLMAGWLAGTPDEIAELFLAETGGFSAAFLERIIYERNRNWMPRLQAMLAANEQELVVVGAAHLVGDGSVVDLLEQAGLSITRIQ